MDIPMLSSGEQRQKNREVFKTTTKTTKTKKPSPLNLCLNGKYNISTFKENGQEEINKKRGKKYY